MDNTTTDSRAVVVGLLLIAFTAGSCWGDHRANQEAAKERDQLMEGFRNSITCVQDAHEAMHDETYRALQRGDIEEAKQLRVNSLGVRHAAMSRTHPPTRRATRLLSDPQQRYRPYRNWEELGVKRRITSQVATRPTPDWLIRPDRATGEHPHPLYHLRGRPVAAEI